MKIKDSIIGVVILLILLPLWYFLVVPEFEKMPTDFSYEADIFSVDNFYDEEKGDFVGEQISKTHFSYEVDSIEDGIIIMKNTFDVRTIAGDKIFTVERLYGVDPKTGKHVAGYGDRDRNGYLFAPKKLKKQDYAYYHINYNTRATLKFQEEEEILGLTVYRYEGDFENDATTQLGHLPGVPEERGIINDVNLQVWIQPISGRMVKYEDRTLATYYDIQTGKRLQPWNKFSNKYTEDAITKQVLIAKNLGFELLLIKTILPLLVAITIAAIILLM